MLLMQNTKLAVAHLGDSRLYRLTPKGGLEQMTVDHEVGQREIAKGLSPSVAYARPDAYQLTQALGPRDADFVHPDINFFEIHEDCLLLLVSDGLSDHDLLETNWQTHLTPLLSSSTNLESGLSDLVDLANEYNGHDNITAILIRVKVSPIQTS
jgi:protein phosphatase